MRLRASRVSSRGLRWDCNAASGSEGGDICEKLPRSVRADVFLSVDLTYPRDRVERVVPNDADGRSARSAAGCAAAAAGAGGAASCRRARRWRGDVTCARGRARDGRRGRTLALSRDVGVQPGALAAARCAAGGGARGRAAPGRVQGRSLLARTHYGDPGARPMVDIDLVVRAGGSWRGESSSGRPRMTRYDPEPFRRARAATHDVKLADRGVTIELHHRLWHELRIARDVEPILARAAEVPFGAGTTLAPDEARPSVRRLRPRGDARVRRQCAVDDRCGAAGGRRAARRCGRAWRRWRLRRTRAWRWRRRAISCARAMPWLDVDGDGAGGARDARAAATRDRAAADAVAAARRGRARAVAVAAGAAAPVRSRARSRQAGRSRSCRCGAAPRQRAGLVPRPRCSGRACARRERRRLRRR